MRTIKLLPAVALLVAGAAVPATAQAAETDVTTQAAAEYYTGQAYGVAASVGLLGSIVVPAQPDTGWISTSEDMTTDVDCTASLDAGVAALDVLCPSVTVDTASDTVVSETTIDKLELNLFGTPPIAVQDLTTTATASCDAVSGKTDLKLWIGENKISVENPNASIAIPGGEIVVNQQVPSASGNGIAVTALVVKLNGLADVRVGHAEAAANNCMSAPPQS